MLPFIFEQNVLQTPEIILEPLLPVYAFSRSRAIFLLKEKSVQNGDKDVCLFRGEITLNLFKLWSLLFIAFHIIIRE